MPTAILISCSSRAIVAILFPCCCCFYFLVYSTTLQFLCPQLTPFPLNPIREQRRGGKAPKVNNGIFKYLITINSLSKAGEFYTNIIFIKQRRKTRGKNRLEQMHAYQLEEHTENSIVTVYLKK